MAQHKTLHRLPSIVLGGSPRQHRGQSCVLTIISLMVVCGLRYKIVKKENNIAEVFGGYFSDLMFPLIPLYISIYLIYFIKAGSQRRFSRLFTRINHKKKHWAGLLTLFVFLVHWVPATQSIISRMFTSVLATLLALTLFILLQLHRNDVEDEIRIARSKHHVAPGLALPFFQVIEGIVRGNHERNELSFDEARDRYTKENRLNSIDWISEKIVILFLESDVHKGTAKQIREMERVPGEEHVSLSNLTLIAKETIQPRESVLNVVKIRSYPTDGSTWQNNYVVIAENRPLQTLMEMKNIPDNQMEFTETDYELQYKLYYEELKRLIAESEFTKTKVEVFHYSDNTRLGTFSKHLKRVVEKLKRDSAN